MCSAQRHLETVVKWPHESTNEKAKKRTHQWVSQIHNEEKSMPDLQERKWCHKAGVGRIRTFHVAKIVQLVFLMSPEI